MTMQKLLSILFIVIILIALNLLVHPVKSYSDQLDDITNQINTLNTALNMSIKATTPLESEVTSMQQQIAQIKNEIVGIKQDIELKTKNINDSYQNIAQKETIIHAKIRDYYIKSSSSSPIFELLSASSAQDLTNVLAYQKASEDQDKAIITNIALSVIDLENKKQALESEKNRLATVQSNLDDQTTKLNKVIAGAKAYQASLSSQIASLTSQQQQLLAQKYASLGIPQTAYGGIGGGCSSDLTNGKNPGFSPRFGFFTFGVPNRVGMNQYGAKGRASAGQSYTQILNAYYQNIQLTSMGNPTIHVTGTNDYGESFNTNWDLETYVQHIYEMPTNWPAEALKSQAIAARSYAMATTNNGANAICSDQHCQEVKTELNSQAWIDAVNATKGIVMTNNGQPIKAWFSSTFGGYEFSSGDIGWDSTPYTKGMQDTSQSVSSFSDLANYAYDKDSPWFECDWGSRSQYNGTAWLQSSEVADIVNVILLAKADSSTISHLSQPDKPNPDGVDTWDASRVRQELQNRNISAYNSVSSMSVNWDQGSGKVTSVSINGDGGSQSIDGSSFKSFFDLRAPANIQIVGPLYNIVQQ